MVDAEQYEGWTKTSCGIEDDEGNFIIKNGKLFVMIERSEYSVADGETSLLVEMAEKYTDIMWKVVALNELDTVDFIVLPQTEEIKIYEQDMKEWGDPILYTKYIHDAKQKLMNR